MTLETVEISETTQPTKEQYLLQGQSKIAVRSLISQQARILHDVLDSAKNCQLFQRNIIPAFMGSQQDPPELFTFMSEYPELSAQHSSLHAVSYDSDDGTSHLESLGVFILSSFLSKIKLQTVGFGDLNGPSRQRKT